MLFGQLVLLLQLLCIIPRHYHTLVERMRYWLQYHNYDRLGYLPGSYEAEGEDIAGQDTSQFAVSCVTTSKRIICDAIGDIVFFVMGYGNRPKKYVLWSWSTIDGVENDDNGYYNSYGDGKVLNPLPLLSGDSFDLFKKENANFSVGFQQITKSKYLPHLLRLAHEFAALPLDTPPDPQEQEPVDHLHEGAEIQLTINTYERNAEARRRCIDFYGLDCCVCDFNFSKIFGDALAGLIHVHHLESLSKIGKDYVVDPIRDLRPICPNCHAAVHHRTPAYSIEEIRDLRSRQDNA